jgi:hypothetical protein
MEEASPRLKQHSLGGNAAVERLTVTLLAEIGRRAAVAERHVLRVRVRHGHHSNLRMPITIRIRIHRTRAYGMHLFRHRLSKRCHSECTVATGSDMPIVMPPPVPRLAS